MVLFCHIMKFCWCQHCSWLYSQTDLWDLKVLIFARNSFPEVELASWFSWAISFVKNSLYAYQHKFINNKLYDQLNTLFKIHCQPLLWCCFFSNTSGNCRCKYVVKLKAFSTCYSLKIYQETGLGNDSTPDMFSSFLLPCVYHTIRYVQTEISLVLMLSRKQTNVSPMYMYFHQIESGVEYFTFFGSKSTIFPDVAGKVYQLSVLCHM